MKTLGVNKKDFLNTHDLAVLLGIPHMKNALRIHELQKHTGTHLRMG